MTDSDTVGHIRRMAEQGSCLTLTWDEESGYWDISWITSGIRYSARHQHFDDAIELTWMSRSAVLSE
jgi:hypothetical protein